MHSKDDYWNSYPYPEFLKRRNELNEAQTYTDEYWALMNELFAHWKKDVLELQPDLPEHTFRHSRDMCSLWYAFFFDFLTPKQALAEYNSTPSLKAYRKKPGRKPKKVA